MKHPLLIVLLRIQHFNFDEFLPSEWLEIIVTLSCMCGSIVKMKTIKLCLDFDGVACSEPS
jgi:hypothetical protein